MERHCGPRRTPADVVLVTAPRARHQGSHATPSHGSPPLGVLYLAAAARTAGWDVSVLDGAQAGWASSALAAEILAMAPRVVGVSTLTPSFPEAQALAGILREKAPDLMLVAGGPHASARPQEALEAGFDAVIVGEADEAFPHLLKAWLAEGSAKPRKAGIVLPAMPDLQDMLPAARDLVDLASYGSPGALVTARGCGRRCYFCAERGRPVRSMPLTTLRAELATLADAGIRRVDVVDDAFLRPAPRTFEVARLLAGFGIKWTAHGVIPDILRLGEPALKRLVGMGLEGVLMGAESGDEEILSRLGKGFSLPELHRAVAMLGGAGVGSVSVAFILGHPWETPKTLESTEALVLELADMGVRTPISLLVPYPGTPVADHPEAFGVHILSSDLHRYTGSWVLVEPPSISASELQERFVALLDVLTAPEKVVEGSYG